LLRTKLNQTLVIAHLVPDPPARTTGAAPPRPLTLISALAGYGKTILVSRLIQDNGGNDLASFLDNIPGALSLRR
jgi:hypothetical protein